MTQISYELAKKLKECRDCKKQYLGGNASFRCSECRIIARKTRNPEWQSRYYEKNRLKILNRHKAYQTMKRFTDSVWREWEKTKYHKRRALIEGNGGVHTTNEWLALVKECGGQCVYCKKTKKLTRDHKIPLSRGGTNDISNIQPVCGSCNSSKYNYDKPRFTIKTA